MSNVVSAVRLVAQTTSRAREVVDVREIRTLDLIAENGGSNVAYTDWRPRMRVEVDLSDEDAMPPLNDDAGCPIPLYDKGGFLLKRSKLFNNSNHCPPGILANLMAMTELFEDYEGCSEDSGVRVPNVSQYTQAFTELGNIQATDPPPIYQAGIHQLNSEVSDDTAFEAIDCSNTQGYNLMSHRTRTSAKSHIAQNAALTQLFSGTHLQKANNKFRRAATRIKYGQLPHQHLQEVIDDAGRDICATFRLEVVTEISVQLLREELRTGR